MTGKNFFGRLLTNRGADPPPPDRDEHAVSTVDRPEYDRPLDADDRSPPNGDDPRADRVTYADEPVAELSTNRGLEDPVDDSERPGGSFAPSPLRFSEQSTLGGDGLSTDPPELRAAPPVEPVDMPAWNDAVLSVPPPHDVAPAPEYRTPEEVTTPPAVDVPASEPEPVVRPLPPAEPKPVVRPLPPASEDSEAPHAPSSATHAYDHGVEREPGRDQQPDPTREPLREEPAAPPHAGEAPAAWEPPLRQEPPAEAPTFEAPPAPSNDAVEAPSEPAPAESHGSAAPAESHGPAAPAESAEPAPAYEKLPEHPVSAPPAPADSEPAAAARAATTPAPNEPVAERPAPVSEAAHPPDAARGDADPAGIRDRVVLRLLDKRIVTAEQVKKALTIRSKDNLKATLWRIVGQDPTVDREQVYREAALTYAFTERSVEDAEIDLEFVRQVADVFPEKKRNRLIELRIVPIGYEYEQQTQMLRVVFITHDPSLPAVRELMQDLNLERYELQYVPETHVRDLLARAFPKKNEYLERMSDDPLAYDLGSSYEGDKNELIDEEALEAEINRSSLINLFEGALVEAVHRGASDIHIYPNARRQIEIHFRVDGRLAHWHTEDKVHPESLLAVIKDNTMNVDRFERDMAQDGFIQRKVDDALIRYRVSILPIATASSSLHAESIVIRVLDDRKVITDLSKLGLLKGALERFDMAIRQPHGMVILTGPTGSGKSTTLVAALHQVVTPEVNVLTVEDPVEYIISGVRQIKLNHKLGLEGALRAILRHDPDVVMVGEMRDKETAELAVKLANTGHLTFSTLHTNDAPSAVSRLFKMGVEPFLIAYAINLVVAQRLLRNLCPTCKTVDNDPDPVLLKRLGFTDEDLAQHTLYTSSGDPTCKTCKAQGYKGRRAISEALYFSREIRHTIVEADMKIDEDGLRSLARSQGMLTLQDSARAVVLMGETSVEEMMRVTMTEE